MSESMDVHVLDGDSFVARDSIPATDRGFRFGMSAFETIAVSNGRPILPDEHFALLAAGAAAFKPPAHWRSAALALFVRLGSFEGVVRIYITAGDGNPTDTTAASRVLAIAERLNLPRALPGCVCRTMQFVHSLHLPCVKSGNYWPHIAALNEANAAGFDDAILINEDGLLLGGSMANLFLEMEDGSCVTPAPIRGLREGAVRTWVMRQRKVREGPVTCSHLADARAIFLTNSRIGIRPVTRVDDKRFGISDSIRRLQAAYIASFLDAK